jgi:hypothetical protein
VPGAAANGAPAPGVVAVGVLPEPPNAANRAWPCRPPVPVGERAAKPAGGCVPFGEMGDGSVESGGSDSMSDEPKLDVGLNGLTVLPPNPVRWG